MFTINDAKIDLPKYVFSPGETIVGKIVTYLPSPTKVSEIKLSFYGLSIPPWFQNNWENSWIIFAKQNIIFATNTVCSSFMYDFSLNIPSDIYPKNSIASTPLWDQFAPWWEKIGSDILSQILGTRQLSPWYRFFLDVSIDIPWWVNVAKTQEITINPNLGETIDK